MSGIIGTDNSNDTPEVTQQPYNLKPDIPATLKPGPGRPKKNPADNDDTRATFVVSAELLRKVKYISVMEDCLLKDIVNDALSLYVSKWEENNEKIKMPKK